MDGHVEINQQVELTSLEVETKSNSIKLTKINTTLILNNIK